MNIQNLDNQPFATMAAEGWEWLNGTEGLPYVTNELIRVSKVKAEAYYAAANDLYEMFEKAAQKVIDEKRYAELGIPTAMIPLIEYSWENDRSWHLYGRFDLAGGLDGIPIKLIEFNADTPTCVPETAIVQWALLKANHRDETAQFNSLFEDLCQSFTDLKSQNTGFYPSIALAHMGGSAEDLANVLCLEAAAQSAGFKTIVTTIDQLEFSDEGMFFHNPATDCFERFDYLFKLVPWEFIAWDEPELLDSLHELIVGQKLIVLNPAYTLLYQSKGLLKILWEMFPHHPLLLETQSQPLKYQKHVSKVIFGREGANVQIFNEFGESKMSVPGDYEDQTKVYQALAEMMEDSEGRTYQAGVFVSGSSCGLGFRRGGAIIDNTSQFCGHVVE